MEALSTKSLLQLEHIVSKLICELRVIMNHSHKFVMLEDVYFIEKEEVEAEEDHQNGMKYQET